MGTTNISNVGNVFVQAQMTRPTSDTRDESEMVNFVDMISQIAERPDYGLFPQNQTSGVKEKMADVSQTSAKGYEPHQYHKCDVKSKNASVDRATDRTLNQKTSDYAKNVKDVLKEEFGVTEEELEEAMETLGLTVTDLMNPNMLAELVAELTGCEDVSQLLCNGNFMNVMQAVNELTESLASELGVSLEELKQMLKSPEMSGDLAVDESQNGFAGQATAMEETTAESNLTATESIVPESEEQTTSDSSANQKAVLAGSQTEEVPEEESEKNQSENLLEEMQDTEDTSETQTGAENNRNANQGKQFSQNGHSETGVPQTNISATGQMNTTYVQNAEAAGEFLRQVDVADVIRQIVEYSRTTLGNAATTMEMQLNPEHLGKIYLEVTSKAGTVSAHLMAQNETVKEALEAQIVELKQNMNQAGIKVDAVEVTVGGHGFEKNLEQNAKREEKEAEEQEKAGKQTRRINLNDLDELNGVMSEEENLVAQMMAEQGNSVDYTA